MVSDDQFRLAFDAGTTGLAAWAERQRAWAHVAVESVGHFWRLSLAPRATNACPVELILHRDLQTFDVQFGGEAYEGQKIDAFDLFEPLLQGAVDGHVVTRVTSSAAGGVLCKIETIVQPENRLAWIGERRTPAGERLRLGDLLTRDRHWVPYRRG